MIVNSRRLDVSGFKCVVSNGRLIEVPVTDLRTYSDNSKRVALAALSKRRETVPDRTHGG